jgi:hypothetical protein
MTVIEIEAIETLDFDYEIECDGRYCSSPAEWKFTMKCCGAVFFACAPCLVEEERFITETVDVRCTPCKTNIYGKPIAEVWDAVRI